MPPGGRPIVEPEAEADPIEALYARGVTDGLPVVPPTPDRVRRAIEACGRHGGDLVALVPPNYGRATVEKIAVNAVMAGCRPEYLPVVIAAVEAVCDEAFDLHGVSATTNAPSPLVIVNGPVRAALDVNCGAGVFGSGRRANATIGRALRLVCVNVGGARPGAISMSTLAHPGRYTYCIGEYEEVSPWPSLAVEHGFGPQDSTVAVLAADAPLGVYDQRSRRAADLLATIAPSLAVVANHKMTHWGDTVLVLSPEHAQTIAGDGWTKADIRRNLFERLRRPVRDLVPGKDGGDGLPEHVLRKFRHPQDDETLIPKFRSPENLKIVVAGGTAGRFSAIVPGWTFSKGSSLVFRKIHIP
ncbi:MAG: hypothetical protein AUH81_15575 [Candidatus Rokubacteria bacterium 13_1_40CM_4_69_5]|nr:MAG: hypothetical protein AUH81_15575 [Candidatus Rokubacteria bacterium 13_1_40CM_4_69_5]